METMLTGWVHHLQAWARKHLEANPQLLQGAIQSRREGGGIRLPTLACGGRPEDAGRLEHVGI
jgi:hypothetical protein